MLIDLTWTRLFIECVASHHGLEVVEAQIKQHKGQANKLLPSKVLRIVKSFMYRLTLGGYERLQKLVGKPGVPPRDVLSRDHFQLVLRAWS